MIILPALMVFCLILSYLSSLWRLLVNSADLIIACVSKLLIKIAFQERCTFKLKLFTEVPNLFILFAVHFRIRSEQIYAAPALWYRFPTVHCSVIWMALTFIHLSGRKKFLFVVMEMWVESNICVLFPNFIHL